MRKEFESDLARSVAENGQKKVRGKAWLVMALCAALLVSGFAAVTAVSAADQDQTKLQLKDGSCEDADDCDPINESEDCEPINESDDCEPINEGEDCEPINESEDCEPINEGEDCVPINEGG